MELFLSDKNVEFSNLSHVLIHYLNLTQIIKVSNSLDSSYILFADNKTETNFNIILEEICKKSSYNKILFGKDEEEINQIQKFIKESSNINLENANKMLETKTYIVNEHITICDLFLYVHLISDLNKLSDKDKIQYCNLSRFADFIMHLPGLEDIFAKRGLVFNLNVQNKWVNLNDPLLLQNVDLGKKKKVKDDKFKAKEEFFKKKDENKKTEEVKSDISINTNSNEEKKPNIVENKSKEEKKPNKEENKSIDEKKPSEEKKADPKAKADKPEGKPVEEKKTEPKKEPKQQPKKKEVDELPAISKLDLRVGKIVKIWPNPESDKLYNEEIDIGNGEIRTIASGLKKRIPIEVLQDTYVVVLCNLKARKLCNYLSHGMLLCASETAEDGAIEPLRPPEGSQPGDQITIGNFPRCPVPELNPKKNPWDDVKEELKVNENLVASYGNCEWTTLKGKIKTNSLKNVKIS